MPVAPASDDLKVLADRIEGGVFCPEDPDYAAAVAPWNVSFRHHPAAVVVARSVDDVVSAVRYASSSGLTVGIQATGHGVTATADGAVLVATRGLAEVGIDADRRVARVGGGATWAPVLEATQDVGLAPPLGSSPHTGAVGYTLGGGFGWLGRRYGMAADHVRSFIVVLADGSVVRASRESEPDLFWALRGAGSGSLGVIVEMEIGLVPVTTVYGGNLFYPIESVADVFNFYNEWSEGIADEFTSSFDIFNFPPVFPDPLGGHAFAVVRGCHCGDTAEGSDLVDLWRRWRTPEIDMFGEMSFRDVGSISQDPVDPLPALSSSRWLNGLGGDVLEAMTEVVLGDESTSPILFAETRHGGGAMNNPAVDASYVPPEADRLLQVVGVAPGPEARELATKRVEELWKSLTPRIDSVYLNLTEGEERMAETRNAFDFASWARLVEIKERFDPDNVFAHGLDLTR